MKSPQLLIAVLLAIHKQTCQSWVPPLSLQRPSAPTIWLAAETTTTSSLTVDIVESPGDERSIAAAADFMLDTFWLADQRLLLSASPSEEPNDSTRQRLLEEQLVDLTDKYGERMGKRLMESCLLVAKEGGLVGLVGMEMSLLDRDQMEVLNPEQAEALLKNAVASLPPKQRRDFRKASPQEIAEQLLPAHQEVVCCLSNLVVSPTVRRRGIGVQLCEKVEEIAAEWDFPQLFLKVEAENTAARELYEQKLGYQVAYSMNNAPSCRVDLDAGSFVEIPASTLILCKKL